PHLAARVRRHRRRVPGPRAEPVVVRPRRLPAPPPRLDVPRRRARAARARVPAALAGAAHAVRPHDRRRLRDALRRPRRRAGVRPPLAARGSAAPVRRLALVALVALGFPAAASAHATLRSTTPPYAHEVARAPATIRLHFDQHVKILAGAVKVLDANGRNHALGSTSTGLDIVTRLKPLARGGYTVRWQGISADSHVVSGVWTFGVGVKAPAIGDAYGAGGPTRTEDVVRWLWFLGIALMIGALGLRLVVLRGVAVPLDLARRVAVAAGLGAVVALEAGIAAFSLNCEDALQLSFSKFMYGDLSPMATTRFGRAFIVMTLAFALVLALVYLSWLLDRVGFLWPAFAVALVFAGGLSLSGHDAVDPGSSWLSEL